MVVSSPARWASLVPALACAAACGGDAPGVRLVPAGEGPCGRPADARSLLVTPLGELRAERLPISLDAPVALADLPVATRQLAVEVIGDGGRVLAQGKTAPFELAALADGDVLAVAMAPPDDACPAGALTVARDRPLVAAVGGGVLVAGGHGPLPLASAEWFDPATHTTVPVPLPAGLVGARGLAGAARVPLADGTVALVGGPSPGFTIYDPETGFRPAVLVSQVRAHAAAVALDDRTVLLLGGCQALRDDGDCEAGSARADSRVLRLDSGAISDGPALAGERVGGRAWLDVGPDGRRAVVLSGGADGAGQAVTTAERIELVSGAVTTFAAAGGVAARTDTGAILTAFGDDGLPARGDVAVIVPGVEVARPLPAVPARAGAALVTQEDGLVLAVGGGPTLRFLPAASTWATVAAPGLPALDGGHAAVALADGSVLVVGGRAAGLAQAGVWRFRPRLLGPFTAALTVVPSDDESAPALAPLDPAQVTATPPWRLRGPGHAVVGGPVGASLRVDLSARVPADGAAVVFGHVDAANLYQVVLVPGAAATVERRAAGQLTTPCRGEVVPPAGLAAITADLRGARVRVAMDQRVVLTCDLDAPAVGRVGVGARGAGEGEVITIAVTR